MFKTSNDKKRSKYDIDDDTYDHTYVSSRPSILANNYHTHRQLYLTMIFMWDEKVRFLLSSRYAPLKASIGETGIPKAGDEHYSIPADGDSSSRYSPIKNRRVKLKTALKDSAIEDTMAEIVNLIKGTSTRERDQTLSMVTTAASNEMSFDHLNRTHNRYMTHLKCLKGNNLLTDKQKEKIIDNLEEIMAQMSAKNGIKRSIDNLGSSVGNNINGYVS